MSNYRLSARAIVIKDDKVLLNEFDGGEYYNIPGGGVEVGETLKDAVAREVLEESGYSVTVKEMLYIYEYNPLRDGYRYGTQGALSHVFRCEVDESKDVVSTIELDQTDTSSVCTGCKWVGIKYLKEINLIPPINDVIIENIKMNDFTTKFLENIH